MEAKRAVQHAVCGWYTDQRPLSILPHHILLNITFVFCSNNSLKLMSPGFNKKGTTCFEFCYKKVFCLLNNNELLIPFHQRSSCQASSTLSQVMHLISLLFWWGSSLRWHQVSPEHFARCRSSSDWIHILQPSCQVMTCNNRRKLLTDESTVMGEGRNKETNKW